MYSFWISLAIGTNVNLKASVIKKQSSGVSIRNMLYMLENIKGTLDLYDPNIQVRNLNTLKNILEIM